jgi:hypothetical protein
LGGEAHAVISRNQMMELLLAACPSFAPQWREFLQEWEAEPPLPLYLALGELAVHLVRLAETRQTAELEATFAVIEKLHLEGEPYVREAATIGVLEQLQNTNHHRTTSPEVFLPLLGPESKRWWDKLERFWGGDPRALAE